MKIVLGKSIKKYVVILTATVVFLCSTFLTVHAGSYVSSDMNKNNSYDRTVAANYALAWYNGRNTTEYYDAGLDCTNFVSQCLEKAGMARILNASNYYDTTSWRPHLGSWENAHYFRYQWANVNNAGQNRAYAYTVYTKQQALDNWSTISGNMWRGDIVQYCEADGTTAHSQICSSFGAKGVVYMAQHSGNSKDTNLYDYIKKTSKTYVCVYRIKFSPS